MQQTIKSYTDLEQSKKLSEILPFKSADMCYERMEFISDIPSTIEYSCMPTFKCNAVNYKAIPCWSLAALLNVLPDVHLKKYIYDGITKYYVTLIGIREFNSEHYDNPIDTCYEMIIKLKKQNLL